MSPKKEPSYRIAHHGHFPFYQVDGLPLNKKVAVYLVSVGKEKFEGKWVSRFVRFVEEIGFKKVFIVVADSLQRFNIEVDENLSEKKAFEESVHRGKEWIKRNKVCFRRVKKVCKFIRWEELKKDRDYLSSLEAIKEICSENGFLRQPLLESAQEYSKRSSRLPSVDQGLATKKSCEYLTEECEIFRRLAVSKKVSVILYPSKPTPIAGGIIQYINTESKLDKKLAWIELVPTKHKEKKTKVQTEAKNDRSYFHILPFFNSDIFPIYPEKDLINSNSLSLK
jgi:hypothetical protein